VIDRVVLARNTYHDSVSLMLAARDAESVAGVSFAAALAATPVNISLLEEHGFVLAPDLGPNDMVVAVRAEDDASADEATRVVEQRLHGVSETGGETTARPVRSARAATRNNPEANVAFVSVPGRFAAYEVATALESGLHVFCFSDGVPLEYEAELKRRAVERGLLFMGADCGTAIIDGVSFGFANALKRGPVGIVGASGTGIQQVTCLLDSAGIGISHAVGVGGRDMSEVVGGTMTLHALDLLAADDSTKVIAVISKPPDPRVAERVSKAAESIDKPVVLGFLGAGGSLETTAARCAEMVGGELELVDGWAPSQITPGAIRGFFCGGTLCEEAASVVRSGQPDAIFVDYGDDEYTQGRAHPMIDPAFRNERFVHDARESGAGVILLDVVLGFGAHPNPAAGLRLLIQESIEELKGELSVVVALCGSADDPQGLEEQAAALTESGAIVCPSAAEAGRRALAVSGVAP
jgi:FdrA protein